MAAQEGRRRRSSSARALLCRRSTSARLHVFPYSERPEHVPWISPASWTRPKSTGVPRSWTKVSAGKLAGFRKVHGSVRPVLLEHSHANGHIGGFTDNYLRVSVDSAASADNSIVDVRLGAICGKREHGGLCGSTIMAMERLLHALLWLPARLPLRVLYLFADVFLSFYIMWCAIAAEWWTATWRSASLKRILQGTPADCPQLLPQFRRLYSGDREAAAYRRRRIRRRMVFDNLGLLHAHIAAGRSVAVYFGHAATGSGRRL